MSGRTILVTGAASGIGRACAARALETGDNVVAMDLNADALQAAWAGQAGLPSSTSLARGLGPHNVRVNGIMPGVTNTPMIAGYSGEQRNVSAAASPLGRIGEPEEIADVALFLVSNGARFVTGEMVIANGGAQFG